MDKCTQCNMPLEDEGDSCSCNPNKCQHCCDCEPECGCNCKEE